METNFIATWGLLMAAIALILSGRVTLMVLNWRFGLKSPLERMMSERERKYYRAALAVWGVGGSVLAFNFLWVTTGGRPAPFMIVIVGLVTFFLLKEGAKPKLATVRMHDAFDGRGECLPSFLGYALRHYHPEEDTVITVAPVYGNAKLALTVGDRRVTLTLPKLRSTWGKPKPMDVDMFFAMVLSAVPPSLLGMTVVWQSGQRRTRLMIRPELE
ncbi:MAG TPA: hypothetical protein VLA88_02550 [Candidatus Saccharimonadales bacterium]|nr:hypothetical protein [Candidatus Saccharimonadales bacterium]